MTLLDGELQHRIRFERKTDSRDPLGGPGKPVWIEVVSVWAKVTNNLSATTEAVAAGADRYREQVRFDIRPRDVDPQWRIVFRGRAFDIKSIAPSNDRSEVAIIALAGLSND
ncbi:phage head closure protein [Stenotrophomonas maltophilia]|uniref:phage head closure protein n=1 Tax=Stenotrophomonas maltophilia TaxID=40324 RepID=UPI001312E92B|nr:phage head closure protein [Stenotrophomonas maltophilia]MCU1030218.1 phage head closure protein [Stenotrophomonas maltophilia]